MDLATESKLFSEIHVSTDSNLVLDCVKKYGLENKFIRPENLADDNATTVEVYKYVMQKYLDLGEAFEEIWTLLPCTPLLETSNLFEAYKIFLKNESKFPVIGVTPCSCSDIQSYRIESGFLKPYSSFDLNIRSQDLERRYQSAGAFAIFPPEHIRSKSPDEFAFPSLAYVMDKSSSIDIDEIEDWKLAELIFYGKKMVNKNPPQIFTDKQ